MTSTPSSAMYPPAPVGVATAALEPSPVFKQQVVAVVSSIVLFMLVYILLLAVAAGLALGTVLLGIAIISGMASLLGLLLGAGLMGFGLMIVWFLVKFVFKVQRHSTDSLQQVTEAEQPVLFDFLRTLTRETGTPFPKKVFLSPEVNAYVFYNSSFWSMFFPVRKNLVIGLGLVNALNLSEFKAVMAHEFGHFSQRSMKLGSYVYQVNKMLHNMLYDNAGYGKMLESVASVSDILAFFARLTAYIVGGIQQILQYMYSVINKRYMGLSRQMEFHADAVAASVAGGNHLVTALRRLELADAAWSKVIEQYNAWIPQTRQGGNAFADMSTVVRHLQQAGNIATAADELPSIDDAVLETAYAPRVNVANQWASHPERKDREAHLQALGWTTDILPVSPWQLLKNTTTLQQQATQLLFKDVEWEQEPTVQNEEAFLNNLLEEQQYYRFPEMYGGYYNGRLLSPFDAVEIAAKEQFEAATLQQILTPDVQQINNTISYLQKDIELLEAIAAGQLAVKSFDLDGTKYDASQAAVCKSQLDNELELLLKQRADTDSRIAALALKYSKQPQVDAGKYAFAFGYWHAAARYRDAAVATHKRLEPLLQGQTLQIEDAQILVNYITTQHVPALKGAWDTIAKMGYPEIDEAIQTKASDFFEKQYVYFLGNSFHDTELKHLLETMDATYQAVDKSSFVIYKSLLEWQALLLEEAA